ncbi:hypothetical protein SARC_18152, partial [Sphaeroforma arctica JP610]
IGATKVPTAQTPLGNSNVGFKMLQKMGWAGKAEPAVCVKCGNYQPA